MLTCFLRSASVCCIKTSRGNSIKTILTTFCSDQSLVWRVKRVDKDLGEPRFSDLSGGHCGGALSVTHIDFSSINRSARKASQNRLALLNTAAPQAADKKESELWCSAAEARPPSGAASPSAGWIRSQVVLRCGLAAVRLQTNPLLDAESRA